jgi:hypothetical protein
MTHVDCDGSSMPFVLTVLDLGSHNLLFNPEIGELTGIIDWDRTWTTARCIG